MATKKAKQPYQYEPLVTPSSWRGDEQRFSIRLTQIIDDLYQKYSALRQKTKNVEPSAPADEPVDADTLNGKAPEYYLSPNNLLINSYFVNPVNQRGQTSYTEAGYTIDRWEMWIESGTANVSLMEGYISIKFGDHGTFYQKLAKGVIDLSKQYSLVIKQRGISPIISYPTVVVRNADNDLITLADLRDGNTMEVEWCALYEGEYTAETLPPYVPKGYAVEQLECRRYYRELKSLRLYPYNVGTNTRYYRVNIDPPMRENVAPTITLVGAAETPLNSWTSTGATVTVFGTITNAEFTISAGGSNTASNFIVSADVIKISSDL